MKKYMISFLIVAGFVFMGTLNADAQKCCNKTKAETKKCCAKSQPEAKKCCAKKQSPCCKKGTATTSSIDFEESATASDNKQVSSTIPVKGSCGMCESRIEEAALKTEGVKVASWSSETQMLTITGSANVCKKTLRKNVAMAGHDTDTDKASDEVYAKLPTCCKYR